MHDARVTATYRREHRLPPANGRDTPLGLLEVGPTEESIGRTPVLLLHGATFGSPLFDLALPGYSIQNFLAVRGWQTFALDVRGYGRSLPSPALDAPPEENPPQARLVDAIDDLASGIRFVREQTRSQRANIVSFSWGTVVACAYATLDFASVERLVLYAPLYGEVNDLWIDRIADPDDRTRIQSGLGAYRWISRSDIRSRWKADIPAGANLSDYCEERVLRAIIESMAAADPSSASRAEPAFRAPTGALVDLFEIFNGRPLYDPQHITAPTMIVRGRDDTTSTESDALRLFEMLGAARKRSVTISPGSHFLCVERNAADLFGEIDLFLGQTSS